MKIIATDNFNREEIADKLVAEGIVFKDYAKVMCKALNAHFGGEQANDCFKVVEDDYRLSRGMQDLV